MINFKYTFILLLTLGLFSSCSDKDLTLEDSAETTMSNRPNNFLRENLVKEETTLLMSRVLNSKNVRTEIENYVSVIDTNYFTVSISALLKDLRGISYVEAENLNYLNTNLNDLIPTSFFKDNVLYEARRSAY